MKTHVYNDNLIYIEDNWTYYRRSMFKMLKYIVVFSIGFTIGCLHNKLNDLILLLWN